jgi:probable phosphoglycerate mutase
MKQTLLLIRHGQTSWNVEHRLPGQIPGVELNETGRQQAARLADALTVIPISAFISSPLERASETARIIAQQYKLDIQFEPDLMDIELQQLNAGASLIQSVPTQPLLLMQMLLNCSLLTIRV